MSINVMAASLVANEAKVIVFQHANGWTIFGNGPGVHGFKPEFGKCDTQDRRNGAAGKALSVIVLVPQNAPRHRCLEFAIDVAKCNQTDWWILRIGGEESQKMGVALHHDLERGRRENLRTVLKIEPLIILLLTQPITYEAEIRILERPEFHLG